MKNSYNQVVSADYFRSRLTQIALFITYITCAIFGGLFLFLKAYTATGLILIVSVLYGFTSLFLRRQHDLLARIWYLSILITHMTVITTLFSSSSGFHYYYFIIPALSGVLLDISRKWQRLSASLFFLASFIFYL